VQRKTPNPSIERRSCQTFGAAVKIPAGGRHVAARGVAQLTPCVHRPIPLQAPRRIVPLVKSSSSSNRKPNTVLHRTPAAAPPSPLSFKMLGLGEEKTTMTMNVCPADTVHAPVERVWDLLMQSAGYGRFWEFTVERVEPEGPAMVGQKFVGWTKPLCRALALAARRRNSGIGCGAPPYPVPDVSAVRAHLQQPDHVRPDRRAVLHVALRLRLHPPPWMAGLAMAAFAHERLSQERRRLTATIEARGRR